MEKLCVFLTGRSFHRLVCNLLHLRHNKQTKNDGTCKRKITSPILLTEGLTASFGNGFHTAIAIMVVTFKWFIARVIMVPCNKQYFSENTKISSTYSCSNPYCTCCSPLSPSSLFFKLTLFYLLALTAHNILLHSHLSFIQFWLAKYSMYYPVGYTLLLTGYHYIILLDTLLSHCISGRWNQHTLLPIA